MGINTTADILSLTHKDQRVFNVKFLTTTIYGSSSKIARVNKNDYLSTDYLSYKRTCMGCKGLKG